MARSFRDLEESATDQQSETLEADLERCASMAEELGRMLGGFIRYLYRSGFKDRGRFKLRRDKPPTSAPNSPRAAPD